MEFRAICNPGKANKIRKEMGLGNVNIKGGKKMGKSVNPGGYGMGGGFGGGMDMGGYFPSTTPLDYTHCKYCGRNYNEEAQMREKLSNKKPLAKTQIKSNYGKGQINYPMNAKKGKKK